MRAALVLLVGCGFSGHGESPTAQPPDTDAPPSAVDAAPDAPMVVHDASIDASIDAPAQIDLVLPVNGGTLSGSPGAYCPTTDPVCQNGNWIASNVADGALAAGEGFVAAPDAWCSAYNPNDTPLTFTYTFALARIERIAIQNFGEGSGNYYSTHFRIEVARGAGAYQTIAESDLAHDETLQNIPIAGPVMADHVRLVLTSGSREWWELSEFEVWGTR